MARRLAARVARLEGRGGRLCPGCGGGGPGPVSYRVILPEPVRRLADAPEPAGNRSCPRCGRTTEFWIDMAAARGRRAEQPAPSEQQGDDP